MSLLVFKLKIHFASAFCLIVFIFNIQIAVYYVNSEEISGLIISRIMVFYNL